MFRITTIVLFSALLLHACKPSQKSITDYRYFEKNLDSLSNVVVQLQEPVIQKHDQLSIMVSSATLNQEQAQVFNLLSGTGAAGGGGAAAGAGGGAMNGYLVDYDGTISLPIIGKVTAAGLTKNQLNEELVKRLQPYVKNPVVNIRFLTYRIATIVDAIGQSGGATETGMRENVLLIRQNAEGKMETHRLNLNDALIYQSPYFQLQQNDVVYVLPNDSKLIQYERSNSPFFRDLPVYMGLITSILAFTTLIISLAQ